MNDKAKIAALRATLTKAVAEAGGNDTHPWFVDACAILALTADDAEQVLELRSVAGKIRSLDPVEFAAPVADTGAVKDKRTDAEVVNGIIKRYDEFMADRTAQLFGTPFKAWAAAKYPVEYMANRDFLTAPDTTTATADRAADAQDANTGHGHVRVRPDGRKARCGGPVMCKVCQAEARGPVPTAALWIRVQDLLPLKYEEVMVWPHPTDFVMTAEFHGQHWQYHEYVLNYGVEHVKLSRPPTHWQPLPAAPNSAMPPTTGGK